MDEHCGHIDLADLSFLGTAFFEKVLDLNNSICFSQTGQSTILTQK